METLSTYRATMDGSSWAATPEHLQPTSLQGGFESSYGQSTSSLRPLEPARPSEQEVPRTEGDFAEAPSNIDAHNAEASLRKEIREMIANIPPSAMAFALLSLASHHNGSLPTRVQKLWEPGKPVPGVLQTSIIDTLLNRPYRTARKTASRACTECRRRKVKCNRLNDETDCERCVSMSVSCITPDHQKSGPKRMIEFSKSVRPRTPDLRTSQSHPLSTAYMDWGLDGELAKTSQALTRSDEPPQSQVPAASGRESLPHLFQYSPESFDQAVPGYQTNIFSS